MFPASHDVVQAQIEKQQQLLESLKPPLSDDEARELVKVFGPDDYYGLARTVLHLIESAPGWPLEQTAHTCANALFTTVDRG